MPEQIHAEPGAVPLNPPPASAQMALPLAVGLGDAERERTLVPVLEEAEQFVVVERSLAADQLVAFLKHQRVAAVLVAFDLHRLTAALLQEILQSRTPLVLLVPDPDEPRWAAVPVVLPLTADAATIRQALLAAVRGERPAATRPPDDGDAAAVPPARFATITPEELAVIALVSGHGSPGRTTMAVNLATALGAVAPTILVDADLAGPSVAAYLDADPTHNLYMLAHADPRTPADWDHALAQEVQPLGPRSPQGVVLCGVPKLEMRSGVSAAFFERMLAELKQRYRYVVLDLGVDLPGAELALHRHAVQLADLAVLVADASLVGLWHARAALRLLEQQTGVQPERIALLINRHDRHYHHRRAEIEWNLGAAIGIIPYDHAGTSRAIGNQQPLVLNGRSRAGKAVRDLAERLHGGRILLPPDPAGNRFTRWWRRLMSRRPVLRCSPAVEEEVGDAQERVPADAGSTPALPMPATQVVSEEGPAGQRLSAQADGVSLSLRCGRDAAQTRRAGG